MLECLAQDLCERPKSAERGFDEVNREVDRLVKQCRAAAMQEAAAEPLELVTQQEVDTWLDAVSVRKASARLPRAAITNASPHGRLLSWALLTMILAFGLVPSIWMREVSPVRKRGPQIVSVLSNLRPISYTDELETLFDMAWLAKQRANLENYAGSEQAGGKYDSSLMALGILIALQARRNLNLPSYLLKADLQQGYDLANKNAVLLHAKWAGVGGLYWLTLDASFSQDKFRVKLGSLVGGLVYMLQSSLGQGGRRAVHLFSALTRGLTEELLNEPLGLQLGPTS